MKSGTQTTHRNESLQSLKNYFETLHQLLYCHLGMPGPLSSAYILQALLTFQASPPEMAVICTGLGL